MNPTILNSWTLLTNPTILNSCTLLMNPTILNSWTLLTNPPILNRWTLLTNPPILNGWTLLTNSSILNRWTQLKNQPILNSWTLLTIPTFLNPIYIQFSPTTGYPKIRQRFQKQIMNLRREISKTVGNPCFPPSFFLANHLILGWPFLNPMPMNLGKIMMILVYQFLSCVLYSYNESLKV